MSFVLETVKHGKDLILYNNNKYREAYSVKSGDLVWRCLGKTCKASIRTDQEKKAIYVTNLSHSGPHPVTMRALTPNSPQHSRQSELMTPVSIKTLQKNNKHLGPQSSPVTPPLQSQIACSSAVPTVTPVAVESTSSPVAPRIVTSLPSPSSLGPQSASRLPTAQDTAGFCVALERENSRLKEEVIQLKNQIQCVIEHTIESDSRLLNYTDQLFVTRTPNTREPVDNLPTSHQSTQTSFIEESPQSNSKHLKDMKSNDSKWLTDVLLAAHFHLLNKEGLKYRSDVLFVDPSVTHLLKMVSKPEAGVTLSDLSLGKMTFVFFCLNNCNRGMEQSGGSHWSLVVYNSTMNTATHYDSAQGVNRMHAEMLIANLGLNRTALSEGVVMQQTDDHECGLHVLVNARLLLRQICDTITTPVIPVSPSDAQISQPSLSPHSPRCIPALLPKATTLSQSDSTINAPNQSEECWKVVKSKCKKSNKHSKLIRNAHVSKTVRNSNMFKSLNV